MADEMAIHDETIKDRLAKVEVTLTDVACKVDGLVGQVAALQTAEDRRFTDRLLPDRVRVVEDQLLETRIYLKQAKWAVALALGAMIAGVANFVLNLVLIGAK